MLTQTRHQLILAELEQAHVVSLQDLMAKLSVSESTIRRDLSQLEEAGRLVRVRGGAKRVYHLDRESSYKEKLGRNSGDKALIAETAAAQVSAGQVIYLDAGTTTLAVIPHLVGQGVTVVTNGLSQADLLCDYGESVILLGGQVKPKTRAVIGAQAQAQLARYRFDHVFMGMNGVDAEWGYTTPDQEEAALKQQAMQQANQVYVLADASKLGRVSFCHVANVEEAILITHALTEGQRVPLMQLTTVKEC